MTSTSIQVSESQLTQFPEWIRKIATFLVILVCGLVVFLLGTSYYDRFPTNSSGLFKIGTSVVLLASALYFRKNESVKPYWRLVYAFFVASMVNVITWYTAIYVREAIFNYLNISSSEFPGIAYIKLWEATLVVGTILILIKLSGADLASIYINKGNLKWAMRISLLALVNLLASAFLIAASVGNDIEAMIPILPWIIVFSLANAFMEELWFRGLFLGRLAPILGDGGAIWLTSIWFGLIHVFAVYVSGVGALIFGILTLTLGLAFGLLMIKTKNIWGASLFHAAADVHWIFAFGI
jgi:membrane protease YdiL (CAAX protease family)